LFQIADNHNEAATSADAAKRRHRKPTLLIFHLQNRG
jgi:hypothetical protein